MAAEENNVESLESNELPQPIELQQPPSQEDLVSNSILDTVGKQDISSDTGTSTQQESQDHDEAISSPAVVIPAQQDTLSPPLSADTAVQDSTIPVQQDTLSPPPTADTTVQDTAIADPSPLRASGDDRGLVNTPEEYQSDYATRPAWLPRQFNRVFLVRLIAAFLVLLSIGAYIVLLRPRLPGTGASVRITPVSRTIADNYAETIVTGKTDATVNPIAAHWLAHTTSSQSMNVAATGQGHDDATSATGTVMVTIEQQGKSSALLEDLHIVSNSGVKIIIKNVVDVAAVLVPSKGPQGPAASPYDAYAEAPGTGGNIPAYDIDGTYKGIDDPSLVVFLQNPQPFTGGKGARDYKLVQQSDIDAAANTLENKLADEVPAVKITVQNQLAANEQFIDGVQCHPRVTSNHQANSEAANVTVNVVIECGGTAYNAGKLVALADTELKLHEDPQQGTAYARVGWIVVKILSATSEDSKSVTFTLQATGTWVYQINRTQQQHLANLIAGLPLADAKTQLLAQRGIAAVTIQTSGWLGIALPSAGKDIQIIVLNIKGV